MPDEKTADSYVPPEITPEEKAATEARIEQMMRSAQAKRDAWKAAHTNAEMTEVEAKAADTWPKIFYNVNVPCLLIHNPDELDRLGTGWLELDLASQGLALGPAA